MIREVTGDLLADDARALVNPVNTVGVMGAGLAKRFKAKYPDAYAEYRRVCDVGGLGPGDVWPFALPGGRWIFHLATKRRWRERSQLAYVYRGLRQLAASLRLHGIESVAVPALGAGLGGLPWEDVRFAICSQLGSLTFYDHGREREIDVRLYLPR